MNALQIEKLRIKLARLERKAEKLDPQSIPFKRIMKTYQSTLKKIEMLGGDV